MRLHATSISLILATLCVLAPAGRAADGFFGDLDEVDQGVGVTRQGNIIDAGARPNLSLDDPRPRILFVFGPMTAADTDRLGDALVEDIIENKQSTYSAVYLNPDGKDALPSNGSGGDPTHGYPPMGGFYDSPTDPESRYVWRWIGMHAPDLVVEVVPGDGETWYVPDSDLPQLKKLAEALPGAKPLPTSDELVPQLVKVAPCDVGVIPAVRVATNSAKFVETIQAAVAKSQLPPSAARLELRRRAARSAKQIADELLEVYGKKLDGVAYIPALALVGRLRQNRLDRGPDVAIDPTVAKAIEPYVSGAKKSFDGKGGGSSVAGHLLFGEVAATYGDPRYVNLVLGVANIAFDDAGKPREAMPSHNEMSDAVFMGCPILAQAGMLTMDEKYWDACLRNLRFMQKLCLRADGLYRHSPLDEAAWGRGNGFPALGLSWSLGDMPESFAGRAEILQAHRAHLSALLKHQDQTGCWHQVIDHPESYREFTCTAMITYAMMRGLKLGWLEPEKFIPTVEKAWEALKVRIGTEGSLVDVCTGTGKQKSLREYYDRPAILGRDDRGGAMALMVVTEREAYEAWRAGGR